MGGSRYAKLGRIKQLQAVAAAASCALHSMPDMMEGSNPGSHAAPFPISRCARHDLLRSEAGCARSGYVWVWVFVRIVDCSPHRTAGRMHWRRRRM